MKRFCVTAALAVSLLGGCVTGKDGMPIVTDLPSEGKFIDAVQIPTAKSYDAAAIQAAKLDVVGPSKGIAPLTDLSQYTQSVLDRIIAAAPAGSPPAKIYLLGNASVGAISRPEGMIFIHHSAFNYLKSEDQLAFLLAHEYSHILLQHSPDSILRLLRPYLVTAMDVIVSKSTGQDQTRKVLQLYGSDIMTRDVLLPVWDRSEETQADLLGTDLMVRAGYNPSESDEFFRLLEEYEASYDTQFQDTRNALEKALQANFNKPTDDQTSLVNQFIQQFGNAVDTLQKHISDRHGEAKDRADKVYRYSKREYLRLRRRKITVAPFAAAVKRNAEDLQHYDYANDIMAALQKENRDINFRALEKKARIAVSGDTAHHPYVRWAFASLRDRQGQYKKALLNFDYIDDGEDMLSVPLAIRRAEIEVKVGEKAQAVSYVEKVGDYYDWPIESFKFLYPYVKQSGDSAHAKALLYACIAKYPQQRDLCDG